MEMSPLMLLKMLIYSFIYGGAVGAVNDINRIIRIFFGEKYTGYNFDTFYAKFKLYTKYIANKKLIKINNIFLNILIFFQDLFLAVLSSIGIIILNFYFNDGKIRIFTIIAFLVGFVLYYFSVGRIVILISEPITVFIKLMIYIILAPVKKTIEYFINLIIKFLYYIRKKLENKINLRYNKRKVNEFFNLSEKGFINI